MLYFGTLGISVIIVFFKDFSLEKTMFNRIVELVLLTVSFLLLIQLLRIFYLTFFSKKRSYLCIKCHSKQEIKVIPLVVSHKAIPIIFVMTFVMILLFIIVLLILGTFFE